MAGDGACAPAHRPDHRRSSCSTTAWRECGGRFDARAAGAWRRLSCSRPSRGKNPQADGAFPEHSEPVED
jgi:hypothetical protein